MVDVVIQVLVGVVAGCIAAAVLFGVLFVAGVVVVEAVQWCWRAWRGRHRLAYERYVAERLIATPRTGGP